MIGPKLRSTNAERNQKETSASHKMTCHQETLTLTMLVTKVLIKDNTCQELRISTENGTTTSKSREARKINRTLKHWPLMIQQSQDMETQLWDSITLCLEDTSLSELLVKETAPRVPEAIIQLESARKERS